MTWSPGRFNIWHSKAVRRKCKKSCKARKPEKNGGPPRAKAMFEEDFRQGVRSAMQRSQRDGTDKRRSATKLTGKHTTRSVTQLRRARRSELTLTFEFDGFRASDHVKTSVIESFFIPRLHSINSLISITKKPLSMRPDFPHSNIPRNRVSNASRNSCQA